MSWLNELSERLDERKLARLGAALWFKVGSRISIEDLEWALPLLGQDGERLVWEALKERVALAADGTLEPRPLARLLEELSTKEQSPLREIPRLVWTLPLHHPQAERLGTTYNEAILDVVKEARSHLLMTSPFLQEHGIAPLIKTLLDALGRGVRITVLTHEAENLGSSQSVAIEDLRRQAERLKKSLAVYTAVTPIGSMLHAKLVLADGQKAIIGSANLTGPGLQQNVEAGVVLGEKEASEICAVIEGLIAGGLVKLVFDTTNK